MNAHSHCRLAAALAVSLTLSAAASAAPRYDVDAPQPELVITSAERVGEVCRKPAIHACTVFDRIALSLVCTQNASGQWAITTRIHVSSRTYVSDARYLRHEMLHLSDVRSHLSEFESAIQAERYATAADCEEGTSRAHDALRPAIDALISATAQQRDSALERRKAPRP